MKCKLQLMDHAAILYL